MEEIKRLEMAVGKEIEQWNVSDLEKFSLEENLELLQLLKRTDVIEECLNRSKQNRDVADVLVPLYIKSLLVAAETAGDEILNEFNDNKINLEELKTRLETDFLSKDKTFYMRLVGYLIEISTFQDCDLSTRELQIREDIADAKEVVCGLVEKDLFNCYTLIMDVMELIFPFRSRYFDKYNVDILDDEDERLELALDNVRNVEMMIRDELEKMAANNDDTSAIISEIEGDLNG